LLALRVFEQQAIIIFSVNHARNKQNHILSATLNNNTQLDTKWCCVSFYVISAPATVVPCQPEEKL